MPKHKWHEYPPYDACESGMKVGWCIYSDRKKAEACAKAARKNAVIKANDGYDFGYCSPGSIDVLPDGRFRVCVP